MSKMKTCPECSAEYKMIEKCHRCGRDCCSRCSIDNQCIDCFMKANTRTEISKYFEDKYHRVIAFAK